MRTTTSERFSRLWQGQRRCLSLWMRPHTHDFRRERERFAGMTASLMLRYSDEIRRCFPDLAQP